MLRLLFVDKLQMRPEKRIEVYHTIMDLLEDSEVSLRARHSLKACKARVH